MARLKGMDVCECDACGYKETLKPDAPNQIFWHEADRLNAEGKPLPYLLCGLCYQEYREQSLTNDKNFSLWMERKRDR